MKTAISIITAMALVLGLQACTRQTPNEQPKEDAEKLPANAALLKVEWPSPEKIDQEARSFLSEKNRKAVDNSTVPVILPKDAEILKNGRVMVDKYGYYFSVNSADNGGIHVSFEAGRLTYGSSTAVEDTGNTQIRGYDADIGLDERGGWYATWAENGIGYSMLVACPKDPEKVRCTSKESATKMANDAVYLGGKGKE